MKQRLAVTTSTLTEVGLHATRRHVRAPEENGKSLVLPNHPGQLPRLKKEEEIYVKLWKKTHPEEQPPSPRRFPATFRSLLPRGAASDPVSEVNHRTWIPFGTLSSAPRV
jgi:hypothetical protein